LKVLKCNWFWNVLAVNVDLMNVHLNLDMDLAVLAALANMSGQELLVAAEADCCEF
jgi:hypothetical protein